MTDDVSEHLAARHSNQHFLIVVSVSDNLYDCTSIDFMCILLGILSIKVEFLHLGRNDAAVVDEMRSRHIAEHSTINLLIIHATGVWVTRSARRSSEEICFLRVEGGSGDTSKEMPTDSIVRLIKIYHVDVDTTVDDFW